MLCCALLVNENENENESESILTPRNHLPRSRSIGNVVYITTHLSAADKVFQGLRMAFPFVGVASLWAAIDSRHIYIFDINLDRSVLSLFLHRR
jgi:hypothetical protein